MTRTKIKKAIFDGEVVYQVVKVEEEVNDAPTEVLYTSGSFENAKRYNDKVFKKYKNEDVQKRAVLDERMKELVEQHGAEKVLWGWVRMTDTDKLKDALADIAGVLGDY